MLRNENQTNRMIENCANNKTTNPDILPVKGNFTSQVSSVQKEKTSVVLYKLQRPEWEEHQ